MIIIGYPGIGKTSIAGKEGCIDLESSNFFVDGNRDGNWHVVYCNIAIDLHEQGYTVLVSSHEEIINRFRRYELLGILEYDDVKIVHPNLGLYSEWVARLRNRYNNDTTDKNEKALRRVEDFYYDDIEKLIYGPFENYQINSTNYDLLDVIKIIKEDF